MKLVSNFLIFGGGFYLLSQSTLYLLIRIFSYDELKAQYAQGGIEAIFSISEINYHTGFFLTLIFAIAALLKGIELKNRDYRTNLVGKIGIGVLAFEVLASTVYFSFLNLLLLFSPAYF